MIFSKLAYYLNDYNKNKAPILGLITLYLRMQNNPKDWTPYI